MSNLFYAEYFSAQTITAPVFSSKIRGVVASITDPKTAAPVIIHHEETIPRFRGNKNRKEGSVESTRGA